MKISIQEMRNKHLWLLEWVVIHAFTLLKKKDQEEIKLTKDQEGLDIKLTMNGVELPLIQSFEDMQKQDDDRIKKEAKELVLEKFQQYEDFLYDMMKELKKDALKKMGIELTEEEEYYFS